MMGTERQPTSIAAKVEQALQRLCSTEAERIEVSIDGDRVVLTGSVRSVEERHEAERIARSVPGVSGVANEIEVTAPEPSDPNDPVYEASVESFPASDPPAWNSR